MRIFLIAILFCVKTLATCQCFISVPLQVCAADCGPVFWQLNDPPGTTYLWSIDCGTITNPTMANPHTACFDSVGLCRIDVIVTRPGEAPDTCTAFILVEPTTSESIVEVICFGDSALVNGTFYTPGLYMDTIFGGNIHGCDSFLTILVGEIPPMPDTLSLTLCSGSGDSIIINGTTYNESNPSGTEFIIGPTGCIETMLTIDLSFALPSFTNESYEGCEGDGYSIMVGNNTYNESNPTGIDSLADINGCDSIVTTLLVFNAVYLDTLSYLGCTGDSFSIVFDSILYNETNPTGLDTVTTVNGCDSIVFINLVFLPPSHDTITYEGCMGDGYSITIINTVFNESNPSGTAILPGAVCDSILLIDLHFADCPDSLILTGHELCVSGTGSQYAWFTCSGIPLPDTTQCVTLGDTGCICVSFTDGSGFDTLCMSYNLCDITCEITAPDSVCAGDSVLFTFNSNDSTIDSIEWIVMLDNGPMTFTATDSLWLSYNVPGCYDIQVILRDSGCVTTCTDTICVFGRPLGNLCCDRVECDSCASLSVSLIGAPPFTIAISNGTTIDTVSGINTSVYFYQACPPYDTSIVYTLLWVVDSSSTCTGSIINFTASVYLEEQPIASISQNGDTLCASPSGYAYNWVDCQNTANLSFDQCYVPTAPGCYCVTVSTLLTDCIDTACFNFIPTSIFSQEKMGEISYRYDVGNNTILIGGIKDIDKDVQFQLMDILGRNIPILKKELIGEDLMSISLPEYITSLIFISAYSKQFSFTRGVFLPFCP